MYEVEVMCKFGRDGSIIPIQIKVEDEDQQRHVFKIKKYKPPEVHLKTEPGYYDVSRHTPDILDFECYIQVFEVEKRVTLRYFLALHKWTLLVN